MIGFNFDQEKNTLQCRFNGRMDGAVSVDAEKELQQKLAEIAATSPGASVVFNLTDVSYIASAFIRICIKTARDAGKSKFSITGTSPFVMKVFKMAGLDKELNVT
jgi:anti-anti-sigma factor